MTIRPDMGIDRSLLLAALQLTPRERFQRAVRLSIPAGGSLRPGGSIATASSAELDAERVLRALTSAGVQFVLIGGFADNVLSYQRATLEVGICYESSRGNVSRLVGELRRCTPSPATLASQWLM